MLLPGARDAAWHGLDPGSDLSDDDVNSEMNQALGMMGRMEVSPQWEFATEGVSGMGIEMGGFGGLHMPVHFEHRGVHSIGDSFDSHSESD